jgi:glycosyltransferase involved in cell wall biosynthesis
MDLRVLVSAYDCEPGRGSEFEVGLQISLIAARDHDVWLLTRSASADRTRAYLSSVPEGSRIQIEDFDLPGRLARAKERAEARSGGLAGGVVERLVSHAYYERWQREAARRAVALDAEHDFDVVHHATIAAYWTRAGVFAVDKPRVYGPVGGAVETPWRLSSALGPRGILEDAFRVGLRRISLRRPVVRRSHSVASIAFAQNPATGSDMRRSDVRVLSNALSAGSPSLNGSQGVRTKDAVFAGKLVGWKGAILAIEAMRYVSDPEVRLLVFGDGPDAGRLAAVARRWHVADRVDFKGMVPRDDLARHMRRAAALVHPALHEEAGVVVGEALALGTPVICLDRGGPPLLVKEWPSVPSHVVPLTSRTETARAIAAAIDVTAADPAPYPDGLLSPTTSFADQLLGAYREAAVD